MIQRWSPHTSPRHKVLHEKLQSWGRGILGKLIPQVTKFQSWGGGIRGGGGRETNHNYGCDAS